MTLHTMYVGTGTVTFGVDASLRDPEMPHKIGVAIGLQLPHPGSTGRLHTDVIWVALIGDETAADAPVKGYRSFLSFLSAAAEAYASGMRGGESDNADLFPADVMEWAYVNSEEISMAEMEFDDDAEQED